MREVLSNLPVTWGEMDLYHGQWPRGTDVTPLLLGLPDDMCPCPHWGYVFAGSIHFRYTDGTRETFKAGDVFYTPSGHTAWADQDTSFLLFSPAEEHAAVVEHMVRMQDAQAAEAE